MRMKSSFYEEIHANVSIVDVLSHYGYRVHSGGGHRKQSFSCDLHGDGKDSRPSAVVYPETGTFYCFACGKPRDALDLIQIKEQVTFVQAVAILNKRYGLKIRLPSLPVIQMQSLPETASSEVWVQRVDALISTLWSMGMLRYGDAFSYWERLDADPPLGDLMGLHGEIMNRVTGG